MTACVIYIHKLIQFSPKARYMKVNVSQPSWRSVVMWLLLSNKMWIEVSRNVCPLQNGAFSGYYWNHQLPLFYHGNWERQCIKYVDQCLNHWVTVWKSIAPNMCQMQILLEYCDIPKEKNFVVLGQLKCWGCYLYLSGFSRETEPIREDYDMNWLMPFWKLRTPMICHLQTGEQGKPVV